MTYIISETAKGQKIWRGREQSVIELRRLFDGTGFDSESSKMWGRGVLPPNPPGSTDLGNYIHVISLDILFLL